MHDEIAHIIPTYERPAVAQRLVNSIRNKYGDTPNIYVCDDSRYPVQYDNCTNVPANAYDIGLSAKRNILVQSTDEPYIFLWDDDYICTEDTSIEKFYGLLTSKKELGIVAGEWMMGGNRTSWFTGWMETEGSIRKHTPPSGRPISTSLGSDSVRWHRVQFAANWFLADRRTLETCMWDETLKLHEHVEFFARLAAIRAPYSGHRLDKQWRDSYLERADGEQELIIDEKGRVEVLAKTTFANKQLFPHRDRGVVHSGEWVKMKKRNAERLQKKGYVAGIVEMTDGRPFYIPDVGKDVPLGVGLLIDTTCIHDRRGVGTSKYYEEQRYGRSWMHLQRQKMGNSEVKMKEWHTYPYGDEDWTFDESLLKLPKRFKGHA